jgi:type II secretory pathway pseudopilin PulG
MFKHAKKPNGFSLTEIIIVVGVFSATITAIYSLVMRNIYVQKHNRDYLAASLLAQEALEMSRNVRDKNWLIEVGNPGAFDSLVNDGDFIIDYHVSDEVPPKVLVDSTVDDDGVADDITDDNCRLYINDSGFFDHNNTGEPTKFYRMVKVSDNTGVANNPHIEITAHVQWWDSGVSREYAASTQLYDWR